MANNIIPYFLPLLKEVLRERGGKGKLAVTQRMCASVSNDTIRSAGAALRMHMALVRTPIQRKGNQEF